MAEPIQYYYPVGIRYLFYHKFLTMTKYQNTYTFFRAAYCKSSGQYRIFPEIIQFLS